MAHLIAAGNWQRGGGKGPRPKPPQLPDGKPRKARRQAGEDTARRLRNLGLLPGAGHGRNRPLSEREQAIAEQLRRAQEHDRPDQ